MKGFKEKPKYCHAYPIDKEISKFERLLYGITILSLKSNRLYKTKLVHQDNSLKLNKKQRKKLGLK